MRTGIGLFSKESFRTVSKGKIYIGMDEHSFRGQDLVITGAELKQRG